MHHQFFDFQLQWGRSVFIFTNFQKKEKRFFLITESIQCFIKHFDSKVVPLGTVSPYNELSPLYLVFLYGSCPVLLHDLWDRPQDHGCGVGSVRLERFSHILYIHLYQKYQQLRFTCTYQKKYSNPSMVFLEGAYNKWK